MAKVKIISKAAAVALTAFAGLALLQACRTENPESYSEEKIITGNVTDEIGRPLRDILVTVDGNRFAVTDVMGDFSNFVLSSGSTFEVTFQDIDGEKNYGLFEEKTLTVTVGKSWVETLQVTLKKIK